MKRRSFFKSIGGIAGSLLLTSPSPSSPSSPSGFSFVSSVSSVKEAFAGTPVKESAWKMLRKQFLFARDYTYFNTGGLGSSPLPVIDTLKRLTEQREAHPAPGHDPDDWWKIKETCITMLGPGVKKEEIALISTATEGINIILNGLQFERGDEVITSTHEHVALGVPLLYKMKTAGIVLKTFEPDLEDGLGNLARIEKLITKRTRLIFISHVTCTTGQVFPVKEIGQLAKSKGIRFALDGAQAVGNIPFNLVDTCADFYTFSGHKWMLGPKRTGILYVKEDMLDVLKPSVVGAYSANAFDLEKKTLEISPSAQRYEYGTQNDALFYGLAEAVDFMNAVGIQNAWKHNKHLAEMFYKNIRQVPGVELLSPSREEYRSSIISFKSKHATSLKIFSVLQEKKIRVRLISEANLDGIRVSFHIYNNEKEVEKLLDVLREYAANPLNKKVNFKTGG
jgi:selenocysteine lyase/cysteine desulfurase